MVYKAAAAAGCCLSHGWRPTTSSLHQDRRGTRSALATPEPHAITPQSCGVPRGWDKLRAIELVRLLSLSITHAPARAGPEKALCFSPLF
eukprot:363883-Chlamydomonas_euryale.AAC.14